MNWKTGLAAAAFGVALMFGGAGEAQANDRDCRQRIFREQDRLQREIRRHGRNSRQARNARIRLDRLRDRCFDRFDRDRDRRYSRRDRDRGRGIRGVLRDQGVFIGRDRDRNRRFGRRHRHDRRCGHLGRGAQFGRGVIFLPNGGAVVLPRAAQNAPVFSGGRGRGKVRRGRW